MTLDIFTAYNLWCFLLPFQEFYDLELKLIRIDNQNISSKVSERAFKREIHDYNTGVRYIIYNITGTPVCKISILHSPQTWGVVKVDSHHVRIKSSRELLFLANYSSYGYEGVEKMRGFEADVWSTQRPNVSSFKCVTDATDIQSCIIQDCFLLSVHLYLMG